MKLNEHKTGLSLGIFVGGVHLVWSILVALGLAQTLVGLSANLHMVGAPVAVGVFSLTNAVLLVIVSAFIAYALGYYFAWIWNKVHEK